MRPHAQVGMQPCDISLDSDTLVQTNSRFIFFDFVDTYK